MITKEQTLLTKEDFHSRTDLPDWLYKEYETFHRPVTDKTFRKIEALLQDSIRMMWLAQGHEPSYRTIIRFCHTT